MISFIPDLDKSMIGLLGINITELTENQVTATMPVDERTRQPYGILHGGASVALAETVASVGTWNLIDRETENAVGLEINANHIRSISEGTVTAVATPLHKGRRTMVWNIQITDAAGKLICISRCTVAIIKKDPA